MLSLEYFASSPTEIIQNTSEQLFLQVQFLTKQQANKKCSENFLPWSKSLLIFVLSFSLLFEKY